MGARPAPNLRSVMQEEEEERAADLEGGPDVHDPNSDRLVGLPRLSAHPAPLPSSPAGNNDDDDDDLFWDYENKPRAKQANGASSKPAKPVVVPPPPPPKGPKPGAPSILAGGAWSSVVGRGQTRPATATIAGRPAPAAAKPAPEAKPNGPTIARPTAANRPPVASIKPTVETSVPVTPKLPPSPTVVSGKLSGAT